MKKLLSVMFVFVSLFFLPLIGYVMMNASIPTVLAVQEKVIYNLPYPGLLPDNPLYVIKIIRDRLTEFATRDNLKKAEFYLLTSDKRIAMALALAKKGKEKLAMETYSKAEKYFLKIPALVIESKKQGVSPTSGFVDILKLSNGKHREVGDTLLKELPQGTSDSIIQTIKLNEEVKKKLDRL